MCLTMRIITALTAFLNSDFAAILRLEVFVDSLRGFVFKNSKMYIMLVDFIKLYRIQLPNNLAC